MTSRRVATTDEGEILDRQSEQQDSSPLTYERFQVKLKRYTAIEENILSALTDSLQNNLARETFDQLVRNFKSKDSLIRGCKHDVDTQIKTLEREISVASQSSEKRYATELKKLEVSKLKTFKLLLDEELQNEDFRKTEALKKFMAECVNNGLAVESPDV